MAFKILLTENHSAIGGALFRGFEDLPLSLTVPEPQDVDWHDDTSVRNYLMQLRPAVVVSPPEETLAAAAASLSMARVCAELDLTLIHFSSYKVFAADQNDGQVLSELDSPMPSTELGHLLFELENSVLQIPRSIVIRLPWLLDGEGGMIFQAAQMLLGDEPVIASENWRGTPVFIEDAARAGLAMVQQILCGSENWGVFHYHSSDSCSEAEFIDYVARLLHKKGCQVAPISVVNGAQRLFEGNSWLVGSRCTNCFGIQFRSWRQGTKGRLEGWLREAGPDISGLSSAGQGARQQRH